MQEALKKLQMKSGQAQKGHFNFMLNFKTPSLDDVEKIKDILKNVTGDNCQMCLGSFFNWGPEYNLEIAFTENCLITKGGKKGKVNYCFPQGDGDKKKIIEELINEENLNFYGLSEYDVEFLKKEFPGKFQFKENRDSADYIYLVSDLAELKGKKYHSKRNHIKYFEKNYNWTYERLTKDNISDCIRMTEKWIEENEDKLEDGIDVELDVIKRAFDNFEILGFTGALLRVDGEVVAWTLGEKLSEDTFCTHFEKAFASFRGAYPMINRELAKNELGNYTFVNREEDMGIEGLRKAKMSYHPVKLGIIYNAMANMR